MNESSFSLSPGTGEINWEPAQIDAARRRPQGLLPKGDNPVRCEKMVDAEGHPDGGPPTLWLHGLRRDVPIRLLAGLGLLHVTAAQWRTDARSWWRRGRLGFHGDVRPAELERFLLELYVPSPILSPWNAGSGFFERDGAKTLGRIARSRAHRLEVLRTGIAEARSVAQDLGITSVPRGRVKEAYLAALSHRWVGAGWLRAACGPRLGDGAPFPPLLGTGGNDGRLDFSAGFLRRLEALFDVDRPAGAARPGARAALRAALYDEVLPTASERLPVGLLHPGAAGGVNAANCAVGRPSGNPWLFVLALEGVLALGAREGGLLPGTVSRVHAQSPREPVRPALSVELWQKPRRLAAQASGGAEPSETPSPGERIDFAVTRRHGLSSFAVGARSRPLRPGSRELEVIRDWRAEIRDLPPPLRGPVEAVDALVEAAMFDPQPAVVRRLLVALGKVERLLTRHRRASRQARLPFLPPLPPALLDRAHDGSVAVRWARALAFASSELRRHWVPLTAGGRLLYGREDLVVGPEVVASGHPSDFAKVLGVRARSSPGGGPLGLALGPVSPSDVEALLGGADPLEVAELMPAFLARASPAPSPDLEVHPRWRARGKRELPTGPAWLEALETAVASRPLRGPVLSALVVGDLDRALLSAGVARRPHASRRLAWLAALTLLRTAPASGLVS